MKIDVNQNIVKATRALVTRGIGGSHVEKTEEGWRLLATDGKMLVSLPLVMDDPAAGSAGDSALSGLLMFPGKTNLKKDEIAAIDLSALTTTPAAIIGSKGTALTVALVDGVFPNWRQVIPSAVESVPVFGIDAALLATLADFVTDGRHVKLTHLGGPLSPIKVEPSEPFDGCAWGVIMPVRLD